MSKHTKKPSTVVDGLVFIWEKQRLGMKLQTEYTGTEYKFDVLPAAFIDTTREHAFCDAILFNVSHIGPKHGESVEELQQYVEEYIERYVQRKLKRI